MGGEDAFACYLYVQLGKVDSSTEFSTSFPSPMVSAMDPFDSNEYTIRTKLLTVFGSQFHVFNPQGEVILYSKQKAFRMKEDIRVYASEAMTEERLIISARQFIDFSAAYDVVDPQEDRKLGALRRKGFSSMFRDSWEFLDENDQPFAKLQEDSMMMAMLRRMLANLIPQSFHAVHEGQNIIEYKQHFNPFLYKLDVRIDPTARDYLDPRLALAAGILLAAIEGRQE